MMEGRRESRLFPAGKNRAAADRGRVRLFGLRLTYRLMIAVVFLLLLIGLDRLPAGSVEPYRSDLQSALTADYDFVNAAVRAGPLPLVEEGMGLWPFGANPAAPDTRRTPSADELAEFQQRNALLTAIRPPHPGAVIRGYGWQAKAEKEAPEFHTGVDLRAERGEPLKAAAAGTVVSVRRDDPRYGSYLVIDHGLSVTTLYARCGEILVTEGEAVSSGREVARAAGAADGREGYLHFELRVEGKAVDPGPEFADERGGI